MELGKLIVSDEIHYNEFKRLSELVSKSALKSIRNSNSIGIAISVVDAYVRCYLVGFVINSQK